MKLCTLLVWVAIVGVQPDLLATSCSVPPPCARVTTGSVLFVGTVVDAGVIPATETDAPHDIHFSVDEIFEGLARDTREVILTVGGSWLAKGHSYLLDAYRSDDNHLRLTICGTSGEVTDTSVRNVLDFLRLRAKGQTKTSMTVRVTDEHKPVPGVDVTISSPDGGWTSRTGANGISMFSDITSGTYRVSAERAHYHVDTESHFDRAVDVVAGACATSWVPLRAESRVTGLVRDAKGTPVASLEVELVTAPEDLLKEVSLNQPFFETKTNADGRFTFESVSPGRYLLGTNVIGLKTSSVPPTYYPGQRDRSGAIPIDVTLGDTSGDLFFNLPDFGGSRDIQICVVDERGRPVSSAKVGRTVFDDTREDFVGLGEEVTTDETGCVKVRGLTGAAYILGATVRPFGRDIWQSRSSDSVVIEPGKEPVRKVLILGEPLVHRGRRIKTQSNKDF